MNRERFPLPDSKDLVQAVKATGKLSFGVFEHFRWLCEGLQKVCSKHVENPR